MKIQNLCKSYTMAGQKLDILKRLNLTAGNHEITVVLGQSGCGKTTLLRLISGLESADGGAILLDGIKKPGLVFQEPRLMPWLTTEDNILFGVPEKLQKKHLFSPRSRESQERELLLARLLSLTGLTDFRKAYPSQLSGGMQQRAALARTLACEPDYLLMDEPFAALDYFTRMQMQQELLKIHQAQRIGILFVTHSIDEALTLGDRILILKDGICQKEYLPQTFSPEKDLLSPAFTELKRDIIRQIADT